MAKRERLPEYGSPEVPQGIMGDVGTARGRMRSRALLDTMPLAEALASMQERSNERLKQQMAAVLTQAGRQAELRRLAEDPNAPAPDLTPADKSLFQINAAYHALYDSGRAQVFAAHLFEEHRRILAQKRTTPLKTSRLGRNGEQLPYDPDLPGEGGFLYDPDAFGEFSRALERTALEAIAEEDPTGAVYNLVAPVLSELHANEREKAEIDYDTFVRLKGKEATDAAIAASKRVFSTSMRRLIENGPAAAFAFMKDPNGFKKHLDQFVETMIETNPAIDVYYPGERDAMRRKYIDSLTMEMWYGIVDQARTNGQDELLSAMATWLNTGDAGILFNKESMAAASGYLEAARESRLNEWPQVAARAIEATRMFGGGGILPSTRQGAIPTLNRLINEANELVPGRVSARVPNPNWTRQQLDIDHAARWIEYALKGIQHGFSVDANGKVETLDLRVVLNDYVPIYERLWSFEDPQSVIDELNVGIRIDKILEGNLTPSQRAAFLRMRSEGQTYYKPMVVGKGDVYAGYVLEDIKEQRRRAFTNPGDTVELANGAGAPSAYREIAARSLDTVVFGSSDIGDVFHNVFQTSYVKALTSGRINEAAFGSPMTGLSSSDAATLNKLLSDAAASPNETTLHGVSRAEVAWGVVNQALRGLYDAFIELGKKSGTVPPPYYADPRPWEVMLAQEGSNKPLIRRVQAATMIAGLNGVDNAHAKAMFIGALEYDKAVSSGVIAPAILNEALKNLLSSNIVQMLAATYAGSSLDRSVAARSIAESIIGWALKDKDTLSAKGAIENYAYVQKASELLMAVNSSIVRIDGDRDMVLNLHGSSVGDSESSKRKLEIALPNVLANASIVNALGTDVSMNRFSSAVPVLLKINGSEYIRFFDRGVPMRLYTADGEPRELLVDISAIAAADIDKTFFGSAKLNGETYSAESGKWVQFLRFMTDDGSIVPVR